MQQYQLPIIAAILTLVYAVWPKQLADDADEALIRQIELRHWLMED